MSVVFPLLLQPSVQDVVFPLHNLKIDTDLGPGISESIHSVYSTSFMTQLITHNN